MCRSAQLRSSQSLCLPQFSANVYDKEVRPLIDRQKSWLLVGEVHERVLGSLLRIVCPALRVGLLLCAILLSTVLPGLLGRWRLYADMQSDSNDDSISCCSPPVVWIVLASAQVSRWKAWQAKTWRTCLGSQQHPRSSSCLPIRMYQ